MNNNSVTDEKKIRGLFEQILEGWNKGDGEFYAAPFDEEADYIAFDGSHIKGRAAIASTHQELFDKWVKGSRLVGEIKDIRFLSAETALLQTTGGTILKGKDKPAPERDSIQTLVAVKKNGEWKFTAFHNNRFRPIKESPTGVFLWMFTDWLWKIFG